MSTIEEQHKPIHDGRIGVVLAYCTCRKWASTPSLSTRDIDEQFEGHLQAMRWQAEQRGDAT